LIASTYPLEVVQADRWIKDNKKLKGNELKAAVDRQSWDDSVKSLAAAPDVLAMMSSKLDWTSKLGDAVLAQQPDVMDAVQRLRARAEANNKLPSSKQLTVTKAQGQGGRQVIAIEQADPETLYVPYYDPAVVYGAWPYAAYPPYYFGYPGYIAAGVIGTGLAFGAGWALGRWASGGNYWGGGLNWNNNNININRPRVNPLAGNNWQHRPEHRHGVRYNNSNVSQRFGGNTRGGAQNRMDFRGRGGDQVLRPGSGQRPSAGQLPAGGRAGAGQRPSQRPSAGQRPSQRPSAGQRPSQRSASRGPSSRARSANALGNIGSGRAANLSSARGHASLGGRGGGGFRAVGGGGFRGGGGGFRGGGGGFRGGGGGGFRGGGGRRSDIALKHDITLLGHLASGIGYYRFSYRGSDRAYVGVMAQEVQTVMPSAVVRGQDGYLRVYYRKLGVPFQTYEQWIAAGARVPAGTPVSH
jgi:hypothetical protein